MLYEMIIQYWGGEGNGKGGKGERGKGDAREACAVCHRGLVGGWLLGCRNSAKTASKILELASEAAQTARIFEATQISAA